MPLDDLLKAKIFGDEPRRELQEFLRAKLPTFTAPTDAAAWRRKIPKLRRDALAKVFFRGIPSKIVNARPRVAWGDVLRPDPAYLIRKLRYEIYPDYWIPALLYEPAKLTGKVPVVLNPNGHHRGGKAATYKQIRCARNIARRGMLALNIEFIGMGDLEADCYHNNIAHLDLTGMAGVGMFYLALKKGLDVLLAHKHADRKRVCVTGLSGGGWQTIVLSALDPRVTVSVPVAGYTAVRARVNCLEDIGDLEQTPVDMTTVADYDTLTAMLAPRPALLILNENDDCCFKTERTRPVIYDAVKPTYAAFGVPDNLQTHSNKVPGTHNYDADNRSQFYKFLKRHFELPADTPEHDIHRPDEVQTEDALRVGLPPSQTTFLRIARERAIQLSRKVKTPRTPSECRQLRKRLRGVIQLLDYETRVESVGGSDGAENVAIKVGPWTIPMTLGPGKAGEPGVLIMSDRGRGAPQPLAIEPPGPRFYTEMLGTGETHNEARYFMMINTAGERLLGIQAAQVLAAARFAAQRCGTGKLHAIGDGHNTSFVLLVAAALEPALFASLTTYAPIPSLRYAMDWPLRYEEAQSIFNFGLLEVADIPQLRALMEGVEYRQPGRAVMADRR